MCSGYDLCRLYRFALIWSMWGHVKRNGTPKFVEENTFEIVIPMENVPELQVGGNVSSETGRVPKKCRRVPEINNQSRSKALGRFQIDAV